MNAPLILALALLAQAEASDLTKLPALTRFVEAPYPESARAEGREATVLMALDVDAEGLVERVEVLESGGPEFDWAAMNAAAAFEFSPAEAGDLGPVPVTITYRYNFAFRPPPVATATAADPLGEPTAEQPGRPAPINFLGTLQEAGTRRPVGSALLTLVTGTSTPTETSTRSDAQGRFGFRGLPTGEHRLYIEAPLFEGFRAEERITPGEALEVLYFLTRSERDPYDVIVTAKRDRREVARHTLVFEDVQRIPGTQGDAIRVVQNMPGVARTPFGLGLLVVRGAPPQDTGVFLDGHRLPILFHFGGIGGITSVVNSRMLETIHFSPGGFSPHQGRVSAGIVELESRFAATDRVHGEAVVDLAGASVFLEGPVSDDPADGAFVLAVRRSYVDGVLAGVLALADASVVLAPRYYDYQARYDRPLGDRRRTLSFLMYGSDDELILLGGTPATGGVPNGTSSRTFFHRFNPRYTYRSGGDYLRISPIFGVDHTNTQSTGDPSGNDPRFFLQSWVAGLRIDGETPLGASAKLRIGSDVLYQSFRTESELPAFNSVKDFPSPIATDVVLRRDAAVIPALLAALFGEVELRPFERLALWPGLRLDIYDFAARGQTFIDPRLVEGRTLVGVDPRLTARYQLLEDVSLKGQVGLYHQPALPTQLYLNADLPLMKTTQISSGFDWQLADRLSLDLQGFYRYQSKVARFTGDTEVVDGTVRLVGYRPDGERRAYGLEMLLKLERRWGLYGWIAYTLMRSEFRREDDLAWAPNFFFDQTHNLNISFTYELGLNWHVGARFRYVTGGGLPLTNARWYDGDRDAYNREIGTDVRRAPAFHQLDLRIDRVWSFAEFQIEAYLEVQNAYNRANTELFAPSFDFKSEVPIPSLPIFPLLGIKGMF